MDYSVPEGAVPSICAWKLHWSPQQVKDLVVEIVDEGKLDAVPDMERSVFGGVVWEAMEPLEEYIAADGTVCGSVAAVYAAVLSDFLAGWNEQRRILYEYKGGEEFRKVFKEDTVAAVGKAGGFSDLRAVVVQLEVEQME